MKTSEGRHRKRLQPAEASSKSKRTVPVESGEQPAAASATIIRARGGKQKGMEAALAIEQKAAEEVDSTWCQCTVCGKFRDIDDTKAIAAGYVGQQGGEGKIAFTCRDQSSCTDPCGYCKGEGTPTVEVAKTGETAQCTCCPVPTPTLISSRLKAAYEIQKSEEFQGPGPWARLETQVKRELERWLGMKPRRGGQAPEYSMLKRFWDGLELGTGY
jgi:hypothetical protein